MPALTNAPVMEHPRLTRAETAATHRCHNCGRSGTEYVRDTWGEWWCPACFSTRHFRCAECNNLHQVYDGYSYQHETGETVRVCRDCRDRLNIWNATPMDVSFASYERIGSKRKFGVEIETASCEGYRALRGHTVFGAKYDCSVSGMEFVSPILYGDEGLAEVENICDVAADKGWDVDSDCGLHIHLDMRDESVASCKSVAYAYLLTDKVWRKLVDSYRADNCTYCRPSDRVRRNVERVSDTESAWQDYCADQNRYELCNLNAYNRHGTYEIRLYQGTINKEEICNWIMIHTRFVDWAASKTLDELDVYFAGNDNMKWEGIKMILGDFPLVRYWIGKRRRGRNTPSQLRRGRNDDDNYDEVDDCDNCDDE